MVLVLEFTSVSPTYRARVRSRRAYWANVPALAVEMGYAMQTRADGRRALPAGTAWGATRVAPDGSYASVAPRRRAHVLDSRATSADDGLTITQYTMLVYQHVFWAALQLALPPEQRDLASLVCALRCLDEANAYYCAHSLYAEEEEAQTWRPYAPHAPHTRPTHQCADMSLEQKAAVYEDMRRRMGEYAAVRT